MPTLVTTSDEFVYSVIDTSTDSTTVSTAVTIVRGVYVNTVLSAHTVVIQDGSTAVFTLPASLPAGSFIPLWDTRFGSGLVVNPDNSSTGNITVVYKLANPATVA